MIRILLILLTIISGGHRTFHNVQASWHGRNYEATCIERKLRHPRVRPDFVQRYGMGVCWFGNKHFVHIEALTAEGRLIAGITIHHA